MRRRAASSASTCPARRACGRKPRCRWANGRTSRWSSSRTGRRRTTTCRTAGWSCTSTASRRTRRCRCASRSCTNGIGARRGSKARRPPGRPTSVRTRRTPARGRRRTWLRSRTSTIWCCTTARSLPANCAACKPSPTSAWRACGRRSTRPSWRGTACGPKAGRSRRWRSTCRRCAMPRPRRPARTCRCTRTSWACRWLPAP